MELLEIRSPYDLTAQVPETRREGAHSYLISCRQFMYVLRNWRTPTTTRGPAGDRDTTLSCMTLAADQIWITEPEIRQIVTAIQSFHSRVSLS